MACTLRAYRSNVFAPKRRLVPLWPPQITAVDLETAAEPSSFETEDETVACLVFADLGTNQVKFRADAPLVAIARASP